jgi:UDP-N-acetylmuramoyl-tripeptide--D-alanyl-D-alanine ligase
MATPIPENEASFSLAELLAVTSGRCLRAWDPSLKFRGVVTDSRAAVSGKLFVALRGESFDGHAFLDRVFAAGAAGALVSRAETSGTERPLVHVEDTLAALGALGHGHRQRWGRELIAVGGSAGKTTTRSAITAVLDRVMPGACHYERGNLNNQVGVPMVLLGLRSEHRACVVEVGTNQTGEIPLLTRMAAPNVAVLTLIGLEHTEGLGDLDAIEEEEGALFQGLPPSGVAVGNGDDPRVRRQLELTPASSRITYGTREGADYRVLSRSAGTLGRARLVLEARGRTLEFDCALLGEPGALAAAAAVAVAEAVTGAPVHAELLSEALGRGPVGEPGRLVPVQLADGTLVLDDTYNANPASMLSSVRVAEEFARGLRAPLVLVLGEMRELGPLARTEHAALGREVAKFGPAAVCGVAGAMEDLVQAVRSCGISADFAPDAPAALAALEPRVSPGSVVLVKASRGIRAERIVEGFVTRRGRAA